jgi:asparagine synthase (glutamine-hydrolysing)
VCGIFSFFGKTDKELSSLSNKIAYRGPDSSSLMEVSDGVHLGFHRLSIMDVSELGNQPMSLSKNKDVTLICNGEIYNYRDIIDSYGFEIESRSDSEVILHLYNEVPFEDIPDILDGVYSFVIYDKSKDLAMAARDPFGVRPMFMGISDDGSIGIASEAKSLVGLVDNISPFPPGNIWRSSSPNEFLPYYKYEYKVTKSGADDVLVGIRSRLESAVRKRLMSDREVGCLLSGGLDSSLIAALVQKNLNEYSTGSSGAISGALRPKLKTFSIGMPGSPDLMYARKVARWIGSDHHEVTLSPDEFLSAIKEVIFKIESYDTTTVRASVGNYLVSKYISENTDCKVIFNGDGADEVCVGYVYNKEAPSNDELQSEAIRLVKDIHMFDVLRSDRSISSNGLEPRTPFLDKDFVNYYMSVPPSLKSFDKKKKIEKYILRKAFDDNTLLPKDVLWRDKCAFSDGVSSAKNSWHKLLKAYVDRAVSDSEFISAVSEIQHCKPQLKESYYYRKIFIELFGEERCDLVPYYWLPKWTDCIDPSARELSGYKE